MMAADENIPESYAKARDLLAAGQFQAAVSALERILQQTNPILQQENVAPFPGWPEELRELPAPAGQQEPIRLVADYFTASLYLTGRCYAAMGDYDKAQQYLEQAARLWPEHGPLHRELAAVYGVQGQYQNALMELQEALAVKPHDPHTVAEIARMEKELELGQSA